MAQRDLVLYGAFDRYNYGDNLMPLVFRDFFRRSFAALASDVRIIPASIGRSNLERFQCLRTVPIREVLGSLPAGSGIVVTGGEVLCARHKDLFLHAQSNSITSNIVRAARRRSDRAFRWLADVAYPSPWEFPFIPDRRSFSSEVRIGYNAVGGSLPAALSAPERDYVIHQIRDSAHFSVRDGRTLAEFDKLRPTLLTPDSVTLVSKLYDKAGLSEKVTARVKAATAGDYVVFQAAPAKARGHTEEIVCEIRRLAESSGAPVVLLPIGYASGHDDLELLSKIHAELPQQTRLVGGLTVWEIMHVLAHSKCYFGTSLHGAITALAFGIPHFGLNPKVRKLDAYLRTWSVPPFDRSINFTDMCRAYEATRGGSLESLRSAVQRQHELVEKNNTALVKSVLAL